MKKLIVKFDNIEAEDILAVKCACEQVTYSINYHRMHTPNITRYVTLSIEEEK